jgi:ribosome-associated heat shock protein Hsp15
MTGLRLDRFLWFARLTKSRAFAQKVIEAGYVRIDGARAASSHAAVKAGQTLTLSFNNHFRVIRIEALPVRRGPAPEAQSCYCEIVAPEPIDVGRDRL